MVGNQTNKLATRCFTVQFIVIKCPIIGGSWPVALFNISKLFPFYMVSLNILWHFGILYKTNELRFTTFQRAQPSWKEEQSSSSCISCFRWQVLNGNHSNCSTFVVFNCLINGGNYGIWQECGPRNNSLAGKATVMARTCCWRMCLQWATKELRPRGSHQLLSIFRGVVHSQ